MNYPYLSVIPHKGIMFQKLILIICASLMLFACKDAKPDHTKDKVTTVTSKVNKDSLLYKLNDNIRFIGDSLLHNKAAFVRTIISRHQFDTCTMITYKSNILKEKFENAKSIGDINGNKLKDTVFVLPPFNYCDEGDSYYFFDTTLPRLYTDSYCCHSDNLFSIGDIDEDGINEICIFYSSCASRFKSLIAYSLKKGKWEQIGRCGFDIFIMKPDKESRVRKKGKGKFEMLEIIDKEDNKEWKQFTF